MLSNLICIATVHHDHARTWTLHFGPHTFRIVTPQIWNTLPSHLKDINISRQQLEVNVWLVQQACS